MSEQIANLNPIAAAIVTIPNNVTPEQVEQSCATFANMSGEVYGAGRKYAADLIGFLGTEWITMPHDQKGEAGDKMRAQRDMLYSKLRALPIPHSNPSVKWKQVKDHAQNILAEQAKAERIAAGVTEPVAADPSGGKKEVRGPQARLLQDLTELHRFCKREEKKLNEAQKKAATHIASALVELGAVLSTL